jgi:transposase InsO family protein
MGLFPLTVAFIWDKGADNAHSGRYTNSQTEFVLLATRNEVRKKLLVSPSDARVGQLLREDPARTPGRKLPLAFWKALETMFRPGLQTLHLFASARREGVFAIGDLTGPAATASVQPTPAVLVVPPVQVADDLSGAEKPRSAAPQRQPPPIPPRPTTLPKPATLVAPLVMEGSSDDDTLRPVPPAQPPPPMPARPTAPPKPVGDRADELHTPAARPPPPAPQADAAARPAESQPPEEPRRPVGDAPEEQQAVMEMRARNQALLNADRNTVLLQLTVDPTARIALARLVKQCAERDKEQLEPSVASKLDAWLESPPAKCRETIEHWKHQHRLTLDLHDVPDVELRAALLRLKADGKTDECLQWLLRDTERKRWLPALDFDALLRLCDERLANAAVVASGHTLAIPVVSMQRRGEKGSCDGGEMPRWLLPAQASEFRDAVIYEAHAALGHPGLARTMTLLSRTGWFIPRLAHHVTAVLRPCVPCSRRKGEPSKWTPVPGVLPSAHQAACFNHRVHVDLIGPLTVNKGQRYIVSFTDAFTRWPEAFVIANKTAALVARRFLDEWVCRYGPPVQLVSDQGSEFVAEVLRTVTAALGVHHFTTTPYHPQANGLEERAHKTLEATIALLGQEQAKGAGEWAELLPQALFAMRTLVHRGTRHTPMHLVFGCEAMLPDALYSCKSVRKHMLDGAIRMEVLGERPEFAKSSSQKQRDDFTHIDQAVNKRAHELRELWQRLYDCAVKEERAVAEEGVRSDGQDADAAGKQAPGAAAPAPPLIVGKFQTGDYVRVFNGDLLAKSTNVLNPKLEARRWTKPWRVQNVIRGAALVLTLATDPLLSRTESCLRVKKIELPEMLREQYDKLYSDAMADKQRHREAQRKDATDRVEWSYPDNEPPGVYVTEVLSIRGKGADRELRVRWSDHTVTWEGYSKISNVAAEPLGVFRQKQQEAKDLGPAHYR